VLDGQASRIDLAVRQGKQRLPEVSRPDGVFITPNGDLILRERQGIADGPRCEVKGFAGLGRSDQSFHPL
jgi:hypothetical protein